MKQRRRILSISIGAALIAGSMLGFSGTAHAAQGDLTVNGTITLGIVTSISGGGFGTVTPGTQTATSAGSWSGTWSATGTAPPCFVIDIAGSDTITWVSGSPASATQNLIDTEITIDSTGCGAPQGVCVLTLNGTRQLTTAAFNIDNGELPVGKVRKGTFTAPGGTQVGSYTIEEGTNCYPGLARQIASALGAPAGEPSSPLPYNNTSNTSFSANLVKTLQTIV